MSDPQERDELEAEVPHAAADANPQEKLHAPQSSEEEGAGSDRVPDAEPDGDREGASQRDADAEVEPTLAAVHPVDRAEWVANAPGDEAEAEPAYVVTAGDRARQSLVLLSILATIALNGLANVLPLMGRLTADISDAYPTPFTPAGYVFAIWGVIYVALVVFGVWQARPAQADDERLRRAAPWVVLSGAFNIVWLVLWHAELVVYSTLPILGLLVSLLIVYERLRGGPNGAGIRWAARVPFGIYLGWASVATIANVAVSGWALDWRGAPLAAETWALIVIAVATIIGLRMLQARGDAAFALVLVWAFVGIAVRAGLPGMLPYGALIASALLLGGAVGRIARPRQAS